MDGQDHTQMSEQEYFALHYGDFFVDEFAKYEREIEDDNGITRRIWLKKFSEKDAQEREEGMIDQSGVQPSAKNQRRKANRGQPPALRVKLSHRRRFDLFKGVESWDLRRPKRDMDGNFVFEMEGGDYKTDENGFRIPKIEDVPCVPKEKMRLTVFVSEQMIKHVRKLNDLPLEDEDEEPENDEPVNEEPEDDWNPDLDPDFGNLELPDEEDGDDNVRPLAPRKTPNGPTSGYSENKPNTG